MALFIGATIFFFVGPETIFKDDCKHGSKTTLVDELYNISQTAQKQFCVGNCSCYFNSTNEKSYLADWIRNNTANYNITTVDVNFKHFQACLPADDQKDSNVLLLGALEELLGCAGWCPEDTPKFYRFYDINMCVT